MNEEIRCPKCKGDKFSLVNATTLKCAYCGAVFQMPSEKLEPQPVRQLGAPQGQQVVVNITGPQQPTPRVHKERNIGKGCLKAIGIYFVIVVILYLLSLIFS